MPAIVACPSCGGKLRVADALLGQRVRCPACNHTFDSDVEPPPSLPVPQDLPLQLSLDDPSPPPPPPPSQFPGGLFGAVEIKRPGDVEPHSETEPAEPPRRASPRRDWDAPDIRRRTPRRGAAPDRGPVVLTLGIISLVGIVIYCAAPLWIILGLVAWIMGRADLRKMKSGEMDDNGLGITQAGWICGILGVVLNGLIILTCGAGFGIVFYNETNRVRNPPTNPMMRPHPPVPPKKGFPPPNNPPPGRF